MACAVYDGYRLLIDGFGESTLQIPFELPCSAYLDRLYQVDARDGHFPTETLMYFAKPVNDDDGNRMFEKL